MRSPIITIDIRFEHDVVLARQRARQIAAAFGFDLQDQTRISTATSELARNVYQYAGKGRVEFSLVSENETPALSIVVSDQGPGIPEIDRILRGRYISRTGMGVGILGAKRLMDEFAIHTKAGEGTTVSIGKLVPMKAGRTTPNVSAVAEELARQSPQSPYEEVQQQNQELMRALEELKKRQEDLAHLNRELEDTNRGVVALYAELDERADYLQRANEVKTAFLSNMTHEFRTPLNAIQSLTNLLLDRTDGDLSPEQEKQVSYIRRSAEDLSELVNDLLDLAKVEAGKISLRAQNFDVDVLFGTLRGMLKPLLAYNSSVSLIFEPAVTLPPMHTDDRRVSQVLRNLISNALKFTPSGEVRVRADELDGDRILFSVSDTGIGIAEADQERIFQEWVQLESPVQRHVKGTGLGLPLSRRLAQLLGGTLTLRSSLGVGSTFYFTLPRNYVGPDEADEELTATEFQPGDIPILVLEDNHDAQFVYRSFFNKSRFHAFSAKTLEEARSTLEKHRPRAVVMDVLLGSEESWPLLQQIRNRQSTADLPVIVISVQENESRAMALGATAFALKPVDRAWLLNRLETLVRPESNPSVLLVDDDEISRYLLRNALNEFSLDIAEAGNGTDALRMISANPPQLIFLDLVMPELGGLEVLEQLRSSSRADIPVVINTSKVLTDSELDALKDRVLDVIPKNISREDLNQRVREALQRIGVHSVSVQKRA